MNQRVRLLFDECVGEPVMESLSRLFDMANEGVEVKHIRQFQMEGVPDEVWLPQIQTDGDWAIITGDRGKAGNDTEKLPLICERLGITFVVLSGQLHDQKNFDKIATIFTVFRQMIELIRTSPRGSRLSIRKTHPTGRVTITRVEKATRKPKRASGPPPDNKNDAQ